MIDVRAAGVSFPEVLQTRGAYQIKPDLPFVPGQRGRRASCARAGGTAFEAGDRVAAFSHARRASPRSTLAQPHFTFRLADAARLRAGRRADPQLPHGLLRAASRAGGWPRARRCSSTAPRAASAPPRCRSPRASARGRSRSCPPTRRSRSRATPGADEVLRSDGPWKDEVKALGGADVVRRPGRRRPLHRQPALAQPRRAAGRRRLHRRLDPRGQGQPAAAQQHRRRRRGLGRLHRQAPGGRRRDRRGARRADRGRATSRPVVGARLPLERAADALGLIDGRGATGKVVLEP